ncbi:acyl-[acyl-carrier-protein]-phospholipid O-acyltransferase/long-chain-fatty-acid--[acyl-carrier-protein] ligase [Ereboglobus sp. PH5-10]|uniref:MFS transporter n=1 Tax=Ereboglobus sp. PH5-10 TaxID=2940629 RepID=UPI002405F025|nr:MFS transporter [Ereboglobus sp. PH5-10]MDF9827669.1 acyl-[acyl-carrier-protein]-phospholipid O-acyltransferase/long-chain-fatty-acid--[acyl-carrier-protein] ligase [Ereboglobus sp. PH5-10]
MSQPSSSLNLLRTRRFLPLFVVQFFGAFNDNFFKNAFAILATFQFAVTHGWNVAVVTQVIAVLFALPYFLFSAFAGQLSDKLEKSRLVRINKLCEIVIVAFGSAALIMGVAWMLFATIFFLAVQSTFFGPLKYSLLPHHLRESELVGGNAIFEAATYVAIIGGTLLGGVLIMVKGGAYIVSAGLVACALVGWGASHFIPQAPSETPGLKIDRNIFTSTRDLLVFTSRRRRIFLAILGISWFWLIGAFWINLTLPFVKTQLHSDNHTVTAMLIIFAVGVGAGSMFCNRLLGGKPSATYVPLAGLAISVFMVHAALLTAGIGDRYETETFTFFSFTGLWLCVDLLGVAVCGGIFSVPLYALMQLWSPPAYRSRIIAANNVINAFFMAVVAIVCGVLFKLGASASLLILLLAIVNAVIAIYIIALVPEAVLHTFLRWLLKACFKVEVRGLEHFDEAGKRRVIIANHTSFLDSVLLTAFLPVRPTFAISPDWAAKWWLKPFLRLVNVYPVDPTKPMAIKALTALARTGVPIAIFPEGRLTVTGGIMKVYEGPGLIADKANADLIPVQIDGAVHTIFSRMSGKFRRRWFPKITISILPPRKFHPPEGLHGRDGRAHMARELYDILVQINVATADCGRTLFRSVIEAALRHGHKVPILDDTNFRPISYRKLLAASLFLGRKMCVGTKAGDPIGLLIATSSAAVCAFFGVQSMGRVCAMLNYSAGPASIKAACECARIRVVWTARKFIEVGKLQHLVDAMLECGVEVRYLEDAAKRNFGDYLRLPFYLRAARWVATSRERRAAEELFARNHSGNVYQTGRTTPPMPVPPVTSNDTANAPALSGAAARRQRLYDMLANARSRLVKTIERFARYDESVLADKPAVILFTSGSSGTPKGVVLSHRNLISNYQQLLAGVDITSSDRFFSALPIFHAFGLTGGVVAPILNGTPTFMYPTPLHYGIIPEMIYQTNATLIFGTNTFLAGYARRAHPYDLFSVRYIVSGAEKLKTEVRQFYSEQFGARIFEAYGSTEASPGICLNTPMYNRPGSVGMFLPGLEWRLDPVPGIEHGGRLWVRGPNVMLGYLLVENPGVLVPPPGGWYDTGDIVDVDDEGYVTIIGRAKRFAKIAGEMVSLAAVEELASATWPEALHAAISRNHPQKGEEIVLVTDQENPQRSELLAKAKEKGLDELQVPRVLIERAVPVLGSGKPDYLTLEKELREPAEANAAQ